MIANILQTLFLIKNWINILFKLWLRDKMHFSSALFHRICNQLYLFESHKILQISWTYFYENITQYIKYENIFYMKTKVFYD